jgi:dienelactone hydrolase
MAQGHWGVVTLGSLSALSLLFLGCGGAGTSARPEVDAGADTLVLPDTTPIADDSGQGEASPPDVASDTPEPLPPWTPALVAVDLPCSDSTSAVYVTPTGLPALSLDARGDVVRCAKDAALDLATVDAAVSGNGIKATTGVQVYRISFRTTRGTGAAGASTALVYLPDTPRDGRLPVIVVAHPTEGLAPSCAPSRNEANLRELGLPWAGRGYAVIAPDYAGLGNEGVQGYQDSRDTAYSTLDAARALRKLLKRGAFSDAVLMSGYSQGGGASLAAQGLESEYGCGGKLSGVIVFAPEWAARPQSFGLGRLLADPEALTIANGITNPVVAAMESYAWFYNHVSTSDGTKPFEASLRTGMQSALEGMCLKEFGGYLQGVAPHVKQIFDAPFRISLTACLADPKDVACVEPGKSYATFLRNNVSKADPKGAPILYVQGLFDQIMPANTEAACNLVKLAFDGVKPQVCADTFGTHTSVVGRNVSFTVDWGEAILGGKTPPTCSSTGMPVCAP